MKTLLFFLMLVLLPGLTRAEWVATPPALYSGELAVLRWQGDHPPDMTLGAFAGKLFFSEVNSLGPVILLGIDIETPVGQYPVKLISVSKLGDLNFEPCS